MIATKRKHHIFSFISPGKRNMNQKIKEEELLESWRQEAVENIAEPIETLPSETEDFPMVTAEKFYALCSCLKDNGIEETETVAQAICYILCNEKTEQYFQPSNETVQYFRNSGYLNKELLFDTPIIEECFPDEPPFACRNFREYAMIMMFPDPTYVEISAESQDLITSLINAGKMAPFEALRAFESDYRYDEEGREYISFPAPEKIMEIYHKKHSSKPLE